MADLDFRGISLAAADPVLVASFWGALLGGTIHDGLAGSLVLTPGDGSAYRLTVLPRDTPKLSQNRIHCDLPSDSEQHMQSLIELAIAHGGRRIDIGQTAQDGHEVLADPEGNELCIIEPGNRFLAGTGVIGAINCDGSQALGYFWSRALGWPLVWDQDQETAIQAPTGGSKITWSGPPLMPRHGPDRLHLDVAVAGGASLDATIATLMTYGARGAAGNGRVTTMTDPDGNQFRIIRG